MDKSSFACLDIEAFSSTASTIPISETTLNAGAADSSERTIFDVNLNPMPEGQSFAESLAAAGARSEDVRLYHHS